jgi:hypothetical protein
MLGEQIIRVLRVAGMLPMETSRKVGDSIKLKFLHIFNKLIRNIDSYVFEGRR